MSQLPHQSWMHAPGRIVHRHYSRFTLLVLEKYHCALQFPEAVSTNITIF
jgi:hypothetical protein